MIGRSSLRLRAVVVGAAFTVPLTFAACDLAPFAVPGDTTTTTTGTGASGGATTATGGTTSSTAGAGGTTGSGGTTTTGTGGGATTGSGGVGGATTTGSGGATTTTGTGGTGGEATTTTGAGGATTTAGTGGTGGATTTTGAGGGATTTGTGGATTTTGAGGSMLDGGADDASDAGVCAAVETVYPLEPGIHVATCTPLTYATNPPTSGMHYPIWAAFKTYSVPVPRGFTIHALEHGAVVVSYNCPAGCDAELATLQAYLDARPADPLCVAPLKNRFIVTPDPLLDVPFAASAWGASLKSQCLDLPALGAFIDAHYAKAPENFCFEGTDVTNPAANIPAGCGEPPSDAGSD